jgi:hypothetical protein
MNLNEFVFVYSITSNNHLSLNDLAMQYGASASHVYMLGDVERISGYDAERPSDSDSPQIRDMPAMLYGPKTVGCRADGMVGMI